MPRPRKRRSIKAVHETWGKTRAAFGLGTQKRLDDLMEELKRHDYVVVGLLSKFKTLKHDYEHHMYEEEKTCSQNAQKTCIGQET